MKHGQNAGSPSRDLLSFLGLGFGGFSGFLVGFSDLGFWAFGGLYYMGFGVLGLGV